MGLWLRARARLEVIPAPDEQLMMEFWCFGETELPEDYVEMGEKFRNVWFFDNNNKLTCDAGKFAEPQIWMDFLKRKFFRPRGYDVLGDLDIIAEGDPDVFDQGVLDEYWNWRQRVAGLILDKIKE